MYDGTKVVDDPVLSATLDAGVDIATVFVDGSTITVTAGRNRKNIGTVVTLTISEETTGASISRSFKIRGWT